MYVFQHCFICRWLHSTLSEDAGIEPRTVATLTLAGRRSNHSARSHPWGQWKKLHYEGQCCGSGMFIPDPTFFYPGSELSPSRIRTSKNLSILTPKKWFLSSRKYDPVADFLPIPDPGSRGQKGTGSRIRTRNTVIWFQLFVSGELCWYCPPCGRSLHTAGRSAAARRLQGASPVQVRGYTPHLKGLSHEIDFKNFDKNLQNLA